jgi:drug/metabolite transporter (DMT)-like permease
MTAILLALGSGVGYGVSDFLASRVARRVPPVLLVLYSQALQSVVLLVVVVAVRQPYSPGRAGLGNRLGRDRGGRAGRLLPGPGHRPDGDRRPLASSGAVLPVLVDLARGERPGPLVLAGLVMVLGGIAVTSLAASEEPDQAAPAPTWHGPPATRRRIARLRPPVPILLALVAAVLFGLFFVGVDQGGAAAGGSVLWVALGVQLGALPTTLAGALRSRGRRLGIDDPALLAPVALLTVLNLSADAFLAYAVTRGDLAVVSVLAALAVLGTLVVSSAQAAA